jgi:hypothetical protein
MELSLRKPLFSVALLLAVGILIVSLFYLYDGVTSFQRGSTGFSYQLMIGMLGLMTSFYAVAQFMKWFGISQQTPTPNIVTVIECRKCGFKQIRKFVKGDYVFKSVDNCQKCNEPMLITGIYAEELKKKATA